MSRDIRLGLDTSRRLLAEFGNPHRDLDVVLVAGTNGKGSTATLLASMTRAAGYRTGLFTSPALEVPQEQIRVDGEALNATALAEVLREVGGAAADHGLEATPFEILTVAALVELSRRRVDLAVIEAGMGGAGDATNVTDPRVSVITTVDLDHEEYLGESTTEIAEDKAGVLRAAGEAVIGWIGGPAEKVLRRRARSLGARVTCARSAVRRLEIRPRESGQSVTIGTVSGSYVFDLPLVGRHQAHNLALAVLAAEALRRRGRVHLEPQALRRGVAASRWPGRLEWIRTHRVSPRPVLLDAAHNPGGIEALARYLEHREEPFDLLFGALDDKPGPAMLKRLLPRMRRVTVTAPDGGDAWEPRVLAEALGEGGHPPGCEIEPHLAAALERALGHPDSVPLLITGSLRLVGQARSYLRS